MNIYYINSIIFRKILNKKKYLIRIIYVNMNEKIE